MIKCHEIAICSCKPFRKSAVIIFYSGNLGNNFTDGTGHTRRMRWAGHVARMGEERGCIGSCGETGEKETTVET